MKTEKTRFALELEWLISGLAEVWDQNLSLNIRPLSNLAREISQKP